MVLRSNNESQANQTPAILADDMSRCKTDRDMGKIDHKTQALLFTRKAWVK